MLLPSNLVPCASTQARMVCAAHSSLHSRTAAHPRQQASARWIARRRTPACSGSAGNVPQATHRSRCTRAYSCPRRASARAAICSPRARAAAGRWGGGPAAGGAAARTAGGPAGRGVRVHVESMLRLRGGRWQGQRHRTSACRLL